MRRPLVGLVFTMLVAVAACSDGSPSTQDEQSNKVGPEDLAAQVASFDLATGPPGRFLVGMFNQERGNVGYGTVELRFSFLGESNGSGPPQPGPTAQAAFLPVPGSEPAQPPPGPAFLQPSQGRGVYVATVGFDRAGYWEVEIGADMVDLGRRTTTAAFQVLPQHNVPAVGDQAPVSENLTLASTDVAQAAIDSRATGGQPIPDPELHQATIAQAIAAHRPALVVFATPTFCVSRFCGPVTDMVQNLAHRYADRATFIHVEIWKDFEKQQLNDVAADWLVSNGADGNEPWVFLIGADGRIAARWDNVASPTEIESLLQALPPLGP